MPRLLSSSVGAGAGPGAGAGADAVPARAVRKLTKYSFYDDDADVVVLIEFDEATLSALAPTACTVTHGPTWAELRLAFAEHDAVLRLSGLAGRIEGARVKKGKARVTFRLQKAEAGEWKKLLAGAAASVGGDSFGEDA